MVHHRLRFGCGYHLSHVAALWKVSCLWCFILVQVCEGRLLCSLHLCFSAQTCSFQAWKRWNQYPPSFCLSCHSYSWVIHWHQVAFLKLCVGWLAAVGNQQRQTIEVEFHNIVSGHISISKRPKVFMQLWAPCAIAIFALASLPMQGGWCQIVPLQ